MCLTHGGHNTYAKVETASALDSYLAGFVKCISLSNFARSTYHSIFGEAPQKKSNTRWFSEANVVSQSIYPGLEDGRMLEFVTKLQSNSLCEASAGKMMAVHGNCRLFTMLWLEAAVVKIVGMDLMTCNTALQGDVFEFITGYSKIAVMESLLNNPVTPELKLIIEKIADQDPGRAVAQMDSNKDDSAAAVDAHLKKLLEMTSVCGVNVSCGSTLLSGNGTLVFSA